MIYVPRFQQSKLKDNAIDEYIPLRNPTSLLFYRIPSFLPSAILTNCLGDAGKVFTRILVSVILQPASYYSIIHNYISPFVFLIQRSVRTLILTFFSSKYKTFPQPLICFFRLSLSIPIRVFRMLCYAR